MTRQQLVRMERAGASGSTRTFLPGKRSDLPATTDRLLRDLALVLHATATIRRSMEEEQSSHAAVGQR